MRLDGAPHFFGDRERVVSTGLGQQQHEFFAAVATNEIELTQLRTKNGGDLAKHFIAQQVSELVVEALEVVDVEHDHRELLGVAAGAFQFLGQLRLKKAAIECAGESIDVGKRLGL